MLRKLAESALDAADAKALGFKPVANANKLHESFYAVPAFQLPYFDPRGKRTEFYRCRYLASTVPVNGFAALTDKKPQRYSQPPATSVEVYLPPLGVNWVELLANPEVPLLITEGELKAACATKLGLPCIGLGGVWSWKSNRARQPLIPALARDVKWKGRNIYLCYDSDAARNPDVVAAEGQLCSALGSLGALPYIVRLPHVLPSPAVKTGLDDYLVAEGLEALNGLLANAPAYTPIAALYQLNAEVVYVKNPGLVIELATGDKLAPGAFKEHAYANRYYHVEETGARGPRLVKKPAAPAWLGWEQRHEHAGLTYAPGQPAVVDGKYNYWRGWGVVPQRGDVTPWRELLDYLFQGYPKERVWFERWCAAPLQQPGIKMYSAAVMWGATHGTGKSLVGYSLGKLYGTNFGEISDEELSVTHNEWAQNKQFIMGDDVTSGENKRHLQDRLKFMITRAELRLNPKYIPSYTIPDLINYYFTSNHPDAFFLEDTDRRYFVHQAPGEPLPRDFYIAYVAWLNGGGAAALFYHLLRTDLGTLADFDPQGPALTTAAKAVMRDTSQSDLGGWVRQLRDAPETILRVGTSALEGDLFTSQELLALYDPERKGRVSGNGLGRELSRAGFVYGARGQPMRTQHGYGRLYAIKNGAMWAAASPTNCIRHYEEARGVVRAQAKPRKPRGRAR